MQRDQGRSDDEEREMPEIGAFRTVMPDGKDRRPVLLWRKLRGGATELLQGVSLLRPGVRQALFMNGNTSESRQAGARLQRLLCDCAR